MTEQFTLFTDKAPTFNKPQSDFNYNHLTKNVTHKD